MQKTAMTNRRKLFLSIVLSALAIFGLFALTACSDDVTVQDIKNLGFPITVEYDYQGGVSNDKQSVTILVAEGSKIPAPRNGQGAIGIPTKKGYSFKGFNLAVIDDDGKPVLDDDKNMIPSETEWNFETDRVVDKDIYLCATYWDNYNLVLHYGDRTNYIKTKDIEITRFQNGEPNRLFESNVRVPDYTFLSYEFDSETGKKAIESFPFTLTKSDFDRSDDKHTAHVWGDALVGNYSLIRTANDLLSAPIGENINYYLLNNIDLKGAEYNDETASSKIPKMYSGKFIGNNHSISNFTLNLSTLDNTYVDFGLFRSLGGSAEVTDVTFENVVINTDLSNNTVTTYNLGMLSGRVYEGAKITNVKIITSDGADETLSAISYKIAVGIDSKTVNLANDLTVAVKPGTASVDCIVENVDTIASDAVYSSDTEIAIYVTYIVHDGIAKLTDNPIYAFATKNSSGKYGAKTIRKVEKQSDNQFMLERINNSIYDITITIDGTNISAEIVER